MNKGIKDRTAMRRRLLKSRNLLRSKKWEHPSLWYALTAPDGSMVLPIAPDGWEGTWSLSRGSWLEREKAGVTKWVKRKWGWVPYFLQ